jgi:hypothetical protein
MSSSPRLEVHRAILSLHPVRSAEELRAALAFAQRILGLADDHCGGFFDYYLSRYLRHPEHGYTPLLWLHVENSGRSQLEQVLQSELRAYPLIWNPAVWKQADRQGIQLALQTPVPDEALRKRIEQAVPTCRGEYLFAKGYEASGFVSREKSQR